MAYKNLVNVSGLNEAGVWRHLKDWLTSRNGIADYTASGLGWTLHDSSFAVDADTPTVGDWVVLKSTGENGKQALYTQLTYSTLANSIVRRSAGLYWNAATNAWEAGFPGVGTIQANYPTGGTSFNLYIYGSLDKFCTVIGNGTTLYASYFGLVGETLYDSTIATTAGAVTAGSNVVASVDSVPASWAVGKAVFIRDEAHIERTVIGAISGTDVTLATLANGYASGARIARDYVVLLTWGGYGLYGFFTQISRGGVVGSTTNAATSSDIILTGAADPDLLNDAHVADKIRVIIASGVNLAGYYGALSDILLISSSGLVSGNVYQDESGQSWRALTISQTTAGMVLFREV